jgi:hypothetical protein
MISSRMFIQNSIKIIFSVSIFMLASCATGTFPYESTLPDNLTFSVPEMESDFLSKMESGFFARTEASLHIFYADDNCNKTYRGSITVSKEGATASAGLETDRIVYIRLWVVNGNTTRSQEFAFQPEPDYHYTIEYIEKNKAYGKTLQKRHIPSGKVSEFTVDTWDVCDT